MSDSLWSHGLQHASLFWRISPPPLSPGVCSNSCPFSWWWCHPTIWSSVTPFSSCPQTFPSIKVFSSELALRIRWAKYCSFGFNISLPMNIQSWFPLGWIGLISLLSLGLSRVLQHHSSKASILWHSSSFFLLLFFIYLFLFVVNFVIHWNEKIWNASRICVSSLRRSHANLLCIVPILVYVLPQRAGHSSSLWFNSYLPYSNLPLPLCNGLETNCLTKMVAMKTSNLEAPGEGKNGFGALPNLCLQRIATIWTVWKITGKGPF